MKYATPAGTQRDFAGALFDPGRALPGRLRAASFARGYAVHRNSVIKGLIDALRSRFPAAERIVGQEFFIAMAQLYVRAHPPTTPVMMVFGDSFPEFVAHCSAADEMPYLADVCRIEAARTRAYHAADAMPLAAEAFASLDAATLMDVRAELHPSLELVCSAFPALTIWSTNSDGNPLRNVADWLPEDAAIARPLQEVEVRRLPAGGAAFLGALLQGRSLGASADAALAADASFDLTANLVLLIGGRLVVSLA